MALSLQDILSTKSSPEAAEPLKEKAVPEIDLDDFLFSTTKQVHTPLKKEAPKKQEDFSFDFEDDDFFNTEYRSQDISTSKDNVIDTKSSPLQSGKEKTVRVYE